MPNIALIQIKGACHHPTQFKVLEEKIKESASSGAQIVVLPELFFHPYFPQEERSEHLSLAHGKESEQMLLLQSLAKQYQIVMVVPFFEKRAPGLYHNSAIVFDADGKELGLYRKMHIPDDPGFYEKYYFTPGDLGYKCFKTRYGNVGVLICWDQWFPEAARLTALKGCELLVYPTAIGWDKRELSDLSMTEQEHLKHKQVEAWKTIQKSHAIANGIYVAAVNRVGVEDDLCFWGNSFIADPMGEVLQSASADQEELVQLNCDFSKIEATRNIWPFLRDRRIESYGPLQERFNTEFN